MERKSCGFSLCFKKDFSCLTILELRPCLDYYGQMPSDISESTIQGAVITLKRLQGCQPLHMTSFSTFFSSTRPHFNQKSQNFPIFCLKYIILVNFQFLRLKIGWKKSSSGSLIWTKNQFCSSIVVKKSVQQVPNFGADPFNIQAIFRPSGCTSLPKWKLTNPLGTMFFVSFNIFIQKYN